MAHLTIELLRGVGGFVRAGRVGVAFLALIPLAACTKAPAPAYQRPTAGHPVPNFTLSALDGTPFVMAEQKGKVVLVNVFGTWCPHCSAEAPRLENEFWKPYKDRGLVVVAINAAEKAELVRKYQEKYQLTYPILLDPNMEGFPYLMGEFNPWKLVVDRNGSIQYSGPGFDADALQATIHKLLPPPVPPLGLENPPGIPQAP